MTWRRSGSEPWPTTATTGCTWRGQDPPTPAGAHYYRIHGGDFLVEFDNRQNGANHIHSVWRDVENDFASDVLREHLLLYHVI